MAKFNKILLQSYILTNCKRRLFLELGRDHPDLWFNPLRPIPSTPPERLIFQTKYLKEKGKEYEQIVYSYLKKLNNTYFREYDGEIEDSYLYPNILINFSTKLKNNISNSLILLLEYEFEIPRSFFYPIFMHKAKFRDIPVEYSSQRPDLIFIGNGLNKYVESLYEILADGSIQKIPKEKENERLGISIFDIKYTNEENVGKKHFLEIFYYLKTLAFYLKHIGLENIYYVRANFNGILSLRGEEELKTISSIEDLFNNELVNLVSWKEANRIYNQVIKVVKELWKKSPCPINQIKTNIHDGCGYCQFIEDCKATLGMKEKNDPENWSIKLIPFTSKSIAQQLINEFNFKTIGDLIKNFDKIKIDNIPKPLYSELPNLKLKIKALKNKRLVYPKNTQIYSYSIPRYSPIRINFDVEYDRNTDRIFAVGILLKMFISSKLKYHGIFDNWWRIWKNGLEENKSTKEIQGELNDYLIREIPIEIVDLFLNCLKKLKTVEISLRGEKTSAGSSIMYRFAKVNEDITNESEADLTITTILRLNLVLQMCNIIEDFIVIDINGKYGKYYIGPDTSIFYWSRNQLEHLQDMLQRNLNVVISNTKARAAYEAILMYFTPSDTEVSNPYQHKKLFDVQSFAETCVGFPDIINYTWHSIAKKLFKLNINTKMYWIPHFNFLDLANWLLYLREKDPEKKKKKLNIIRKQIIFKLHVIDQIRSKFQKEGNTALSENARTISRHDYKSAILPSEYHDISHVWYLFSRLNNALQQQDEEYYRTMFPDFSIGKLSSARIQHLEIIDLEGKSLKYKFTLIGLSCNMKIQEGNRVLLIPNSKRGLKIDNRVFKWIISINDIKWDPSIGGYIITTKPTSNNVYNICSEEGIDPVKEEWYIYPISPDSWSNKLYNCRNNNGLLQRENFGQSWLGARLAFLWNLRIKPKLKWPYNWSFTTPSIYLFAPLLLKHFNKQLKEPHLFTKIAPTPDPSQKEAIKNSLYNIISAILGPPGTGKSQTIAAFIDEYVIRRTKQNKSIKILITSFSYAALRVIIDKIRKSKDIFGKQTPSSKLQMIFIHSSTQNPIPKIPKCRDIDDLMKDGNTWKLNGKPRSVTNTILLEESLENNFIIFANAHQLYHLTERVADNFAFDLIFVDEASQMPADYFMSSLQFIKKPKITIEKPTDMLSKKLINDKNLIDPLIIANNKISPESLTKIVIVGDHNQLSPVRVKKPPKNLELILDNVFRYYVEGHNISSKQLKVNYRSHKDIVEFTSLLGLYEDLQAYEQNAKSTLQGNLSNINKLWLKEILLPKRVACSIIHNEQFEIGISLFEAQIVAEIVKGFYIMVAPSNRKEEIRFWSEQVGVVAPHNAQGRTIIRKLYNLFKLFTKLSRSKLMQLLKDTVYSVEKFQGSDRDLIICSIGLSDEDKLQMEDDFIYNLNRFNVLTSRAKNKLIFISSDKFIQYIPNERELIKNSSKIYMYVEEFCNKELPLQIKNKFNNIIQEVRLRYKE